MHPKLTTSEETEIYELTLWFEGCTMTSGDSMHRKKGMNGKMYRIL